ncbi:hypothetical protein GCM10020331_033090 [Ectobacillus funiculus]
MPFLVDGVIPLAKSFDTVGWMAKNPELLLEIAYILIDGQSAEGQFHNIFWAEEAWGGVEYERQRGTVSFPARIRRNNES